MHVRVHNNNALHHNTPMMSYNANEHDHSGRCIRHPEVKLRRRKIFLPGTKVVFKWSKRLRYCPCCVMEFVLAVDPEVTGEVGLSRKGRLEITNLVSTEVEHTSISEASSSSSHPSGSNTLSEESDASSQTAHSYVSQKSNTCGQLNPTHATLDDTTFRQKDGHVVKEVEHKSMCNSHEDYSLQQQRPQQLHSSPTDVRYLQKHQKDETKPPVDDVFVCKDIMCSASLDSTSGIDDPLSLDQVETAHAHNIESELAKEQAWMSFLVSWQKEKDEMTAAMNDLKKENKQLQISMKCMKKLQNKSSKHKLQSSIVENVSLSDSQESHQEKMHQQGSIIQSLRDEIKCVSTDQIKGMQEVESLLQQQVKALEEEKEVNKAMHEQEVDILQQEIKLLQQRHTETMCRMVKMALEREKESNKTLLHKFEKIEQERRLQIEQKLQIGKQAEDQERELKEEMTKEEVLQLQHKYFSLKSELDELKTKLADEKRRKEKRRMKKKKKDSTKTKCEEDIYSLFLFR
jgi:hypothetical protein